jgi:hypothetical protein
MSLPLAPGSDNGCGPVRANDSVAEVTRSFAVTWPGQVVTQLGHDALVQAPPQMPRRSVRNLLDNAGRAAGTVE